VRRVTDDVGRSVVLSAPPSRIVSLVPSITECLFALGAGQLVVGATRFCVEPPGARAVARVGGTKNPDLSRIRELRPQLVFANAEENRLEDVDVLTAARIPTYVTFPRTVAAGISMVRTIGELIGRDEQGRDVAGRLDGALAAVRAETAGAVRPKVFCPIWKRPWMAFNRDTFAHAMLDSAGADNVCAEFPDRYPVVDADRLLALGPDMVLLPSEPYRFRERDRAELEAVLGITGNPSRRIEVIFIDGQALTWYGPRIDWGLQYLREQIAGDLVAPRAP
jgi:ABC-type Fe3+-hydroxamate transport system substrate-binding protein